MVNAVLHIGLGKCGSSALQSALSNNPVQSEQTGIYKNIKYVSINRLGHLSQGKSLYKQALFSPSGYSASCSAGHMRNFSEEKFSLINSQLKSLSDNGENLIVMSFEGWWNQAGKFARLNLLEKLGLSVDVICYVRNPVEWLNSAWWQWGAWSEETLNAYVANTIEKKILNWPVCLQGWQQLRSVKSVTIRVLPKDIVEDFYKFVGLGTATNQSNRNNTSLPGEILRFYQMHHELRPSESQPSLDFILSNSIEFDKSFEKAPWVLNKKHIQDILEKTRASNLQLLIMLDKESRKVCQADLKWWESSAFENKEIFPEDCSEEGLPYNKLDQMLLRSFQSINKLYLENLQLKKQITKLKDVAI